MLRPEQVVLGGEGDMKVFVTDTVFQGSSVRVVGRTTNDTEVSAIVPAGASAKAPSAGETVSMHWHASAPYLLEGWPETAGSTTTNVDSIEAAL
jgi:hypothetical protein